MNNDNTDYVSNESGTLSRLFKLPQHGTTVRTELIAGMTTFLTMVYIVFVNPQILGAAQMDPKVVFVTTCLIAGIGSIAMGIFAKEGANKRGNSSRLTQSFHFFMFEPIFSPVNALNQPI